MTKKSKIAILIGIIVLVVVGVYLSNVLGRFGICRPGTEFIANPEPSWPFLDLSPRKSACYSIPAPPAPKNINGSCDKQADCGTAKCVLRNENNANGKGICLDWPIDDYKKWYTGENQTYAKGDYYLDKNGNIQKMFYPD